MFDEMVLETVIGLMVLANRLVEAFVTPIFERFNLDKFWILYIAWIISGAFVFPTGLNLFSEIIPNPLFGQILTAIVAGGGANILYDIADKTVEE